LPDDAPAASKVPDPGTVAAMECFYRPRAEAGAGDLVRLEVALFKNDLHCKPNPDPSHLICCIFIAYKICCYFCDNLG
jgi:hypothetical protein